MAGFLRGESISTGNTRILWRIAPMCKLSSRRVCGFLSSGNFAKITTGNKMARASVDWLLIDMQNRGRQLDSLGEATPSLSASSRDPRTGENRDNHEAAVHRQSKNAPGLPQPAALTRARRWPPMRSFASTFSCRAWLTASCGGVPSRSATLVGLCAITSSLGVRSLFRRPRDRSLRGKRLPLSGSAAGFTYRTLGKGHPECGEETFASWRKHLPTRCKRQGRPGVRGRGPACGSLGSPIRLCGPCSCVRGGWRSIIWKGSRIRGRSR